VTAGAAIAPLVPPGRMVGLDVARCVALLGMILTHVFSASDENGVTVAQQVAGGRSARGWPSGPRSSRSSGCCWVRCPVLAAVLFGAGAMTLSLYTAHVLLRTRELLPEDDVPTFAAHVLIVLTIGAAYRLARRGGPLERLVTTSANGTRDAVRRHLTTSASAS
jgi:hypothetical protein